MPITIDLNADLGEGGDLDLPLLDLLSSANIACGLHAGDPPLMLTTLQAAQARGVALGAHPGYADRAGFGRVEQHLPAAAVYALLVYQLGAMAALAATVGASLQHVKPHGALYNQAARDAELAATVCAAVQAVLPGVALYGLAGSCLLTAAAAAGLRPVAEVFADRRYQADGQLVPRSDPRALIHDPAEALQQTLMILQEGRVRSVDGDWLTLTADSVCVHGDSSAALQFAQALRSGLLRAGLTIARPQPIGQYY